MAAQYAKRHDRTVGQCLAVSEDVSVRFGVLCDWCETNPEPSYALEAIHSIPKLDDEIRSGVRRRDETRNEEDCGMPNRQRSVTSDCGVLEATVSDITLCFCTLSQVPPQSADHVRSQSDMLSPAVVVAVGLSSTTTTHPSQLTSV